MNLENYADLINGAFKEKFDCFKELLLYYNNKFNLTAITGENEIYIKHFLDSVAGESYIGHGARVIEIGSGGGFPSVPLKIIREDLNFVLVESTGKKCEYLKAIVDKLKFNCVQVLNARAEDIARQAVHREKYDISVARAVARLNTLSEYCLPLVKIGGRFIAYKGDCAEEIKEAEKAIKVLGGEIENTETYELSNGEKRTLVIVRKVASTPDKYPRGQGKERKCPII